MPCGSVPVFTFAEEHLALALQHHTAGSVPAVPARKAPATRAKAGRTPVAWVEEEDGDWNDECEVCDDGGSLLCCFSCNCAAHEECIDRFCGNHRYKGEWLCDACHGHFYSDGRVHADSDDEV
jgi:hypothetical protein